MSNATSREAEAKGVKVQVSLGYFLGEQQS